MLGSLPQTPAGPWGILLLPFMTLFFFAVVSGVLNLVVMFFMVLGGIIGERLAMLEPLRGYGVNLAGSLAGIAAFTAISFLGLPPVVWVLIGVAATLPFFIHERWTIAGFALLVCAMAIFQPEAAANHYYEQAGRPFLWRTFWSPYYRITLHEVPPPSGWPRPRAYFVDVNHDYHQKMLDLSPEFTTRFPDVEPNHSAMASYDLPYQLVSRPERVLVVGAGTGNDVAAALRHGATHVDAVEIDPLLVRLGRKYHPEHPYGSDRVSVVVDDARAFFHSANQKYDLIIFGYLDSHTLLTSFSALRLDDYVYTLESFREARALLQKNGTLVLGFDSGRSYITDRLFATLAHAFDKPPVAYYTGFDGAGVVFVEGKGAESNPLTNYPEISKELESHDSSTILSTDHWPFIYLQSRTVPIAILGVLVIFLCFALGLLRRTGSLPHLKNRQHLHLFFLGAGFMLLETKGVTELSLLFGSTWIVNAVVIAAFLTMGLLANTLVMIRPVSRGFAYTALFVLLSASMFLPYSLFSALPAIERVFAAATLVGLPVFFSGLIFSRSFRDVTQPAQGLGINLLGAVVGGALENLVMVGGTPILGVLAVVLYGFSAALLSGAFATQELRISQRVHAVSE
jgi:Spermine/spermidine synthase domain